MVFLKIVLGVQITWVSLYIVDVLSFNIQGKGDLPKLSVITNVIDLFFRRFNSILKNERRNFRNADKRVLEKVINDKLNELQPFLQDKDINEIKERDDDNTVILKMAGTEKKDLRENNEVVKEDIQNYKKVLEKIQTKLAKETVTEKTKDLIVKTIDSLISRLVENKCDWKRGFRSWDSQTYEIDVMFTWNQEWQDIKKAFSKNLIKYKSNQESSNKDFNNFLDNVLRLFNYISDDIDKIPKRRIVRCNIMNPLGKDQNIFRVEKNNNVQKVNCKYFKVCSLELQDYLINIYEKVNDTASSVTRNYAEMYKRDVTLENEQVKDSIIPALKRVSGFTEANVTSIFIDETKKLKLDKGKNKDANMAILSKYTQNILTRAKDYIYKALWDEISLIKSDVVFTIKDDIRVNSEIELENLKEDLNQKLCHTFQFCNGDYNGRRENVHNEREIKYKPFVFMNAENSLNVTRVLTSTPSLKINDLKITRTTHTYNASSISNKAV